MNEDTLMVIFDLLGDTLMEMLPRLVAEKIGFYLYHWKHVELMKEMRSRIITNPLNISDSIAVSNNRYSYYNCNYKLYLYRPLSTFMRGIYNCNKFHTTPAYSLIYNEVAKLPRNYWYSNGDF